MSETKVYAVAETVKFSNSTLYTEGKRYEVLPPRPEQSGDFDIVADNGNLMWCMWEDDCDVIWSRIEEPAPAPTPDPRDVLIAEQQALIEALVMDLTTAGDLLGEYLRDEFPRTFLHIQETLARANDHRIAAEAKHPPVLKEHV